MNNIVNIHKDLSIASILFLLIGFSAVQFAQNSVSNQKPMKYWTQEEFIKWEIENDRLRFLKTSAASDRREGIADGNKIRTVFYNYGSIGRPNTEPSIEWPNGSNHGYAYEFGPLIGAEVVDVHGDTIPIFSDALIDGGDRAPSGKVWGWQPLPQYLNTGATNLENSPAISDDPRTWPQHQTADNPFYNPDYTSQDDMFQWPGVHGQGVISGDLEAYWVMDDRENDEYEYYPFDDDPTRRGLGLELTCRLLQFSATPAEDVIFYIIDIKNASDKRLNKIVAGMYGDPHIGGGGDFSDDMAGFNQGKNMVYSWDLEGSSNDWGIPYSETGWLGFKFLESPKDSLGNELGLTSMTAPVYNTVYSAPSDDEKMWSQTTPGLFDEENIIQESDNVFLFGTGYFSLDPGESQQFSIALIMGKGIDDLIANGDIAQDIYNRNYQFTKAPDPPYVTAVPGDGKVTLYWDKTSEASVDPFFEVPDFEGYKLYRSDDKGLTWGPVLTNAYGLEVGNKPMEQWDATDDVQGLFPVDQDGLKFYLGNNSGLVHKYTDESVINGITYYYALTAYDSGYVSKNVTPVESGKFLGRNMVSVMPAQSVPGYEAAESNISHTEGYTTAEINITVLDPQVIEGYYYELTFEDTTTGNMVANIVNQTTGDTAVAAYEDLEGYPIIFDGLVAELTDETIVSPDSLSGWAENITSTLDINISLFGGGQRIPRDVQIKFYDTIVDTSALFQIPVKFKITNLTEDVGLDIMFRDNDDNQEVTAGDEIIVIAPGLTPTWQIAFTAPAEGDTINPAAGDVININVSKPIETIDKFLIETKPGAVDVETAKKDFLDKVAVIPNPYIATSSFETPPPSVFSAGRGERRVYFINIPSECTIRIYTLNGELIRTLDHEGPMLNGTEPWNLLTEEGLDIAYGMYIYHIDAGKYGEKIGKFAIIK